MNEFDDVREDPTAVSPPETPQDSEPNQGAELWNENEDPPLVDPSENAETAEAEADAWISCEDMYVPIGEECPRTTVTVEEAPVHSPYRARGLAVLAVVAAVCAFFMGMLMGSRVTGTPDGTAVAAARQAVTLIEVKTADGKGLGSGMIMTSDGYIVTNYHVVKNATEIQVYFTDGSAAEAELVGYSQHDDLAVIKVDRQRLTVAVMATEECYVGQRVYAIGHPGSTLLAWTTTEGIVSYVDRELPLYGEDGDVLGKRVLLQTDTTVNPGNSGGPLVNERGQVVGIVTSRVEIMEDAELGNKDEETYRGLGFALPIQEAMVLIETIIAQGNTDGVTSGIFIPKPVIGIRCAFVEKGERYTVTEEVVQFGQGDRAAVSGVCVISASGKAEGLLLRGDVITHLDGHALTEEGLLEVSLLAYEPGDTVTLTVYRGGETLSVQVILSEPS